MGEQSVLFQVQSIFLPFSSRLGCSVTSVTVILAHSHNDINIAFAPVSPMAREAENNWPEQMLPHKALGMSSSRNRVIFSTEDTAESLIIHLIFH